MSFYGLPSPTLHKDPSIIYLQIKKKIRKDLNESLSWETQIQAMIEYYLVYSDNNTIFNKEGGGGIQSLWYFNITSSQLYFNDH